MTFVLSTPSNLSLISDNDTWNLILRICFAAFVGSIIGLERQLHRKPAGLRTHILVSVGAALFTLIPLEIQGLVPQADALSRIIQGISTGIGFLGAGEIVRASTESQVTKIEVKGLTSAAAIWVSAALGIAAGCGLWRLGLIGAIATFIILYVIKKWEIH
ncbi:MgtC/SapB family protein [Calothrix sp. 336/3]|uniref:MgtC/SapB family protein n=1 Tax=Calothrix sp. 336/3 TaxID=1337936 RepID=UPI0004E344A9|nr:MgtC/SapB family protein [Calothrix sp. 336/3]AKG23475.1 protein SrpB [Calothrix sp. 336/3]